MFGGLKSANAVGEEHAALKAEIARLKAEKRFLAEQHVRDLGSLRTALDDARRAQEQLDGILKSLVDPLVVTDSRQRVVLLNRAAQTLFGVAPDQVVGSRIETVLTDPALGRQLAAVLQPESVGTAVEFSWPGRDPLRPRIYLGRTSAFCDKDGRRAGLVLVVQEVTREREIDRMKCEFVSRAAHELQTPLTAVIGFSELLLTQEALSEKVRREGLAVIHDRAEALSRIVDGLLDLNRIQAGRALELECETTDLGALLREKVEAFRSRWGRHRFELHADRPALPIVMDRHKLSQALDHLFDNAVKFSSSESQPVVIGAKHAAEGCLISVTDRGVGMTAEQVRRACEAFYCGDTPRTSAGGAGLGLCLVKHIVEAHGGRVWIESALGEGTTVSLLLPGGDPALPGRAAGDRMD